MREEIKKIIKEVIRKDLCKEAMEIMELADEEFVNDVIKHYEKNSFNIVCMAIEFAKYDLVKKGKMKYEPNDGFTSPFDYLK